MDTYKGFFEAVAATQLAKQKTVKAREQLGLRFSCANAMQ
jgi:hypothetical protein